MKKSLSSGKASGKWDNVPNWAKRRIAELEVELAHAKGREETILGQFRHAKARAEKAEEMFRQADDFRRIAEAEVERLRAKLKDAQAEMLMREGA